MLLGSVMVARYHEGVDVLEKVGGGVDWMVTRRIFVRSAPYYGCPDRVSLVSAREDGLD